MHKERYALIEQQLKLAMQKYPESTQRKHRERLLKKDLIEIEEEADNDDDQDDDDDGEANTEGMSLGNFLKSRQKKKVAFAPQEGEEDDEAEAMEEIDFDTYKKQFEAEMAEKIKVER